MRKVLAGEPAEDPFAAGGRRRTGRKRAPQLLTPLPPPSHTSGLCTGPSATGSAPQPQAPPRARPGDLAPARRRRACPLLCLKTEGFYTFQCTLC